MKAESTSYLPYGKGNLTFVLVMSMVFAVGTLISYEYTWQSVIVGLAVGFSAYAVLRFVLGERILSIKRKSASRSLAVAGITTVTAAVILWLLSTVNPDILIISWALNTVWIPIGIAAFCFTLAIDGLVTNR